MNSPAIHTATDVRAAIERLEYLCDYVTPVIRRIADETMNRVPAPGKWSRKQIMGHLIDSAANNHHRFVRSQFDHSPTIYYDTDKWNAAGHYDKMTPEHVVDFWQAYNRFLAVLLRQLPESAYARLCDTGGDNVTLGFVIVDYVVHLEHHLRQVAEY
jgi:hypothetical protein